MEVFKWTFHLRGRARCGFSPAFGLGVQLLEALRWFAHIPSTHTRDSTPASHMLPFSAELFRRRRAERNVACEASTQGAKRPFARSARLVLTSLPASARSLSRFHLAPRMCLLLVYRSVWSFKCLHLDTVCRRFSVAGGKRRAGSDPVAVSRPGVEL